MYIYISYIYISYYINICIYIYIYIYIYNPHHLLHLPIDLIGFNPFSTRCTRLSIYCTYPCTHSTDSIKRCPHTQIVANVVRISFSRKDKLMKCVLFPKTEEVALTVFIFREQQLFVANFFQAAAAGGRS